MAMVKKSGKTSKFSYYLRGNKKDILKILLPLQQYHIDNMGITLPFTS